MIEFVYHSLKQHKETNFVFQMDQRWRVRVSIFTQRGYIGMALRKIPCEVPTFEQLNLPSLFEEIAMLPKGLVLVVGGSNSGKTTTLAALINYRNEHARGHIITIENPIEFVHYHKKSIVTQREVGVDTTNYSAALKNTLRHLPDVIMLGEIDNHITLAYAIKFAEMGHFCLAAVRATAVENTFERLLHFFPSKYQQSILNNLSTHIKVVVAQRFVKTSDYGNKRGKYIPIFETLINNSSFSALIRAGKLEKIKKLIEKSNEQGMYTFDQSLLALIEQGEITIQEGLRCADSINNLRLNLKLSSHFAKDKNFYQKLKNIGIEDIEK